MLKADVYWNLHQKCYSVKVAGRVVCHAAAVLLSDVEFVVQPAGREKVLREKRKNVHGFLRGTVMALEGLDGSPAIDGIDGMPEGNPFESEPVPITYNPYKDSTFVEINEGSRVPVLGAERVAGLIFTEDDEPTPSVWALNVAEGAT